MRVRGDKSWSMKGKVIGKAHQPISYIVKTEKGWTIRRNRRDLLATTEKFDVQDTCDYEMEIPTSPEAEGTQQENHAGATSSIVSGQGTTSSRAGIKDNYNEQSVRTRSGRLVRPPTYLRDFVQ